MSTKTRIVLADDHPIVLKGLRELIGVEHDFDIVGEAGSGLDALRMVCELKPDVAVLDISMPDLNGILLSRRLGEQSSSARIIVLTLHEERAYLKQALDAGVRGYVLKRSAAENLVQAIRAVIIGGLYVDPAMATRMFDAGPKRGGRPRGSLNLPELTEREAEVLKLVALGFTTKEIAARLDIGMKSIETYKARGSEKLGLRTRVELIRYASTQGWLAGI